MAAALGVDLSNPNDPEAQMVRLGLRDLDPTRVLKNCQHLFFTVGFSQPRIAQALRMPSAGEKIVHCTLHGRAVGGPSLDGVYELFKRKFCNDCNDCSPRAATWEYSDSWQKQENERFDEYMQKFKSAVTRIGETRSSRSS